MTAHLVYITTKNKDEARSIGKALLEDRLVACVNILDGMQSMYWWEGAIEDGSETVLIVKTRDALLRPLTEKVKSLHSYSCPCVVALPISTGNPEFLAWIHEETREARV